MLSDTHTMLVECKWSRRPVGVDILEQLETKSRGLMKEVDGQALLFGLCLYVVRTFGQQMLLQMVENSAHKHGRIKSLYRVWEIGRGYQSVKTILASLIA